MNSALSSINRPVAELLLEILEKAWKDYPAFEFFECTYETPEDQKLQCAEMLYYIEN